LEKRRRDEKEKARAKSKKKRPGREDDEDGGGEKGRFEKEDHREDEIDEFALQKLRLKADLERYRL
jgi:hypothetical protein